jgi:CheY-like chemotaxis protein
LRELAIQPRPTVIAITGYGQPEDRARALAAGFDHHLVKPVDPDMLLRLIAATGARASRSE